jgi:lysophospholipase L1-like esterase
MQMNIPSCRIARWIVLMVAVIALASRNGADAAGKADQGHADHWIGTWAAAPQSAMRGRVQSFQNQTLRLIVHTSAGGKKVRIRISNGFGDRPLIIGAAHIARRAEGADIDPASDRKLTFHGQASVTIPAQSLGISDPVELEAPALSDLAISLFLPQPANVTTWHMLAKQTNYVSAETGDTTADAKFAVGKTISSWPFLAGVDVAVSKNGATIVALGSSLTDGDGSTKDTNGRWPDVLAQRLQQDHSAELGVLNEGIIGNRLLSDVNSPGQAGGPPPLNAVYDQLGPALGESGVARFQRDVLDQAGVKYVILALGVNDILFPGSFIPESERVDAQRVIAGYRQLIARAHKQRIRIIGTTIPPFEHALFQEPFFDRLYSPEKEKIRQEINRWIQTSGEFDGLIDFDAAVRDPQHPTQILPAYDSGDHLHVNNEGNVAQGNVIDLGLFR